MEFKPGDSYTSMPWSYCWFGSRQPQQCEYCNPASCSISAGGGSCTQFVKNTMSVKCNKAKHNKMNRPVFSMNWK